MANVRSSLMRRCTLGAVMALAALSFGAAASRAADLAPAAAVRQGTAVVNMTNRVRFAPETITIRAGDTVVWQNTSFAVHTVTAESVPPGAAPFDSGNIGRRGQFSHTFTVPGEYRYYCIPHRQMGMVGTVVVVR